MTLIILIALFNIYYYYYYEYIHRIDGNLVQYPNTNHAGTWAKITHTYTDY